MAPSRSLGVLFRTVVAGSGKRLRRRRSDADGRQVYRDSVHTFRDALQMRAVSRWGAEARSVVLGLHLAMDGPGGTVLPGCLLWKTDNEVMRTGHLTLVEAAKGGGNGLVGLEERRDAGTGLAVL